MKRSENPASGSLLELPRWLIVGFSGHRHLHGKDDEVAAAIDRILDELSQCNPRLAGICSTASGSDTLFAKAALARDMPLSLVLPFDLKRFQEDFHDEPSGAWEQAKKIIDAVPINRIDVVHQLESDLCRSNESTSRSADEPCQQTVNARIAHHAYYEATIRTVDGADVLLAIWNGEAGEGPGGTRDAIGYAHELGKPVIIYNPVTRIQTPQKIELPDTFRAPARTTIDLSDPKRLVERYREQFDQAADLHKKPTVLLLHLCIYLHLLASAGAAFAIVLVSDPILALFPAAFEVSVLIFSYIVLVFRAGHHRQWFRNRIAAEICRTFLATWEVRRHPVSSHQPRQALADHLHEPHSKNTSLPSRILQRIGRSASDEARWSEISPARLFRTLRFLRHLDATPFSDDLAVVRKRYIKERLLGKKQGQVRYFERQLRIARSKYNRYAFWGSLASFAAVVSAIMAIISILRGAREVTHIFECLGIVMPLCATAFTFMMVSSDATRRVRRYEQMLATLKRLFPRLKAAPTWDALARAVTEMEEELLQEFVEWQSFVHYTEHLH